MKRIFVLGRHRSGTTWLCNILADHPDVFTPTHKRHKGQHESAFFSAVLPYFGHARTKVEKRAMQAAFEASDYVRLLDIDDRRLETLRDLTPEAWFRALMDEATQTRDKTAWVEKSPAHSLWAREIQDAIPDALFVAILRNPVDTVRSQLGLDGIDPETAGIGHWLRREIGVRLYTWSISRFAQERPNVLVISYEDLLADYSGTLHGILDHLGLAVNRLPRSRFEADSTAGPKKTLPLNGKIAHVVAGMTWFLLPESGKKWLEARARRPKGLPNWLYRLEASPT